MLYISKGSESNFPHFNEGIQLAYMVKLFIKGFIVDTKPALDFLAKRKEFLSPDEALTKKRVCNK